MTSIHLRPIREADLPVLERLVVDPLIAGPFDWHGFGDPGGRRRRLAEDGYGKWRDIALYGRVGEDPTPAADH